MTGFKQIKKATPSILTYPTSVTQEKNIKKKKSQITVPGRGNKELDH